ncbi:MAG: DsbA family oxidoreductase [Peptococcaceae bacterium]|nr:DsbA family oxidoreductase [Peptococcaceae bacterium]
MLDIEIWSDYTCPYCYIGKTQLFQVLKEMGIDDYKITHRVYLLDAGKESHPERTFVDGLGLAPSERAGVEKKLQSINDMAAKVGLHYDMANIPDIATEDAHRLTLWAQEEGKHIALNTRIFKAYFEECQDISNFSLLADLAAECGLDRNQALAVLNDAGAYRDQLFEDFEEADERDIDLVPHYTFNGKIDIMGIMTLTAIRKHIEMAL